MKMLARPGGMRAALSTAITYTHNSLAQLHFAQLTQTYLLSLLPINVVVSELGEVPELEL